jgi:hypothetical protein
LLARVVFAGPGFWIITLAVLAFSIYVAVDASKYPDWAFQRAGTQKWLYQVLTPISGLCCGIVAIVVGIIWFASKKAQVEQAARGGMPGDPYGSPPPPGTWTPPPPPTPGPEAPPPPDAPPEGTN